MAETSSFEDYINKRKILYHDCRDQLVSEFIIPATYFMSFIVVKVSSYYQFLNWLNPKVIIHPSITE